MDDLEAYANDAQRISELEATARRLSVALRKERLRTEALVDAVMTAAKDSALLTGRPKGPSIKRDRRKAGAEVALVHSTDWQCGKETESYNSEVCAARQQLLAKKVASIADVARADHPVRECHLLLGGDMIEGISIFPGQPFEVDSTLYDQVFTTARIVEQLVIDLQSTFEKVVVWDIHGNHGRVGKRGELPALDNFDRMIYRMVKDRTDVEWNHSDSWHQIVTIGNYHAILAHGDQIKSFGGNLPLYGVMRKVSGWKAGVVEPFRDAYIGHFHTHQSGALAAGGHVFMTGSPESGSEYAREFIAAKGTPSQRLHFIDPEKGRVTAEYQVHLDDV